MSVRPQVRAVCVGILAALTAGLAGCSSDKTAAQIGAMNDTNMKKVTNLYTAFMSRNGWKGPKDEGELKGFIRSYDPDKLKAMRVDTGAVDGYFVSERDNKPFKIRYSQSGGPTAAVAVTFEEDGSAGRRQVGFTNGTVEEVDEARYKELWAGKGSSAPAAGAAASAPGPPGGQANRPSGAPAGAVTGPPGK
jgi:hypothetical protein